MKFATSTGSALAATALATGSVARVIANGNPLFPMGTRVSSTATTVSASQANVATRGTRATPTTLSAAMDTTVLQSPETFARNFPTGPPATSAINAGTILTAAAMVLVEAEPAIQKNTKVNLATATTNAARLNAATGGQSET